MLIVQLHLQAVTKALTGKEVAPIGELLDKIKQLQAENKKLKKTIENAIKTMESEPVQGTGEWETGMLCGLEDMDITDRYQAFRSGYDKALDKVQEWIIDNLEQSLKEPTNARP